MGKIRSKKVSYYGIDFDSLTEGQYYLMLRADKNVKDIQTHPKYTLLDSFKVPCNQCRGFGKAKSDKTDKNVQCRSCKGTGRNARQKMIYTADFLVTYQDGYQEVIDIKGGKYQARDKAFALRRKLFEQKTGINLAVICKEKGEWVRL